MKRLLTVVLSVVLFATLFSWITYIPISQRDPNVYYFGFLETFIFVIIYAGPIYFFVGLPLSIFIDKLIKKSIRKSKWAKYFIGLGLYSLVGILVGVAFLISMNGNIDYEIFTVSIYGFIASNVYYHLLILVSNIHKMIRILSFS